MEINDHFHFFQWGHLFPQTHFQCTNSLFEIKYMIYLMCIIKSDKLGKSFWTENTKCIYCSAEEKTDDQNSYRL